MQRGREWKVGIGVTIVGEGGKKQRAIRERLAGGGGMSQAFKRRLGTLKFSWEITQASEASLGK